MAKFKNLKFVFVAFLLGIALYTSYRYLVSLNEKRALLNSINKMEFQLAGFEEEKQNLLLEIEKEKEAQGKLNQEKHKIKECLIAGKKRLSRAFNDYSKAQKEIDGLNTKISLLKEENNTLIDTKSKLSAENENLKAKINSVAELKKAMLELRKQAYKVSGQIKQRVQENKLIEGNRGYLLKSGRPTAPAKVKIEVIPAATK